MEKITKIYANANGTPKTTHYNGSWHVIKHESVDSLDYSITIWDTISEGIYAAEESLGYELQDDEYNEEVAYILETVCDCFNIEIIID
jgi:hypothetical protein